MDALRHFLQFVQTELLSAQLIRAAALLVGFWVAARLLSMLLVRLARSGRALEAHAPLAIALRALRALIVALGLYYASKQLPMAERTERFFDGVLYLAALGVATLVLVRLTTFFLDTFLTRDGAAERHRMEQAYLPLLRKLVGMVLATIALIIAFRHFDIDVTGLVTTLGVGGLAVGLAAKDTLSNMIAGFTLLVDRPFRPGDRVRLASGEVGDVLEIGIRSTRIRLLDQHLLVVPNAELGNTRIINYNQPTPRAVAKVELTLAFGADVARAEQVLLEAARALGTLDPPPEPTVLLRRLGERGLEVTLHFGIAEHADVDAVEDRVRREVYQQLSAQGVQLFTPQLEVTLHPDATKAVPGRPNR
jgi:small-conductance mechanosensitive channel